MPITLTFTGLCAGGNHAFFDVTIDGKVRQIAITKTDATKGDDVDLVDPSFEQLVIRELRRYAKREGLTTWAGIRNRCINLSLSL